METQKLITKRKGAWEIRNEEGEVIYRCGKRPGPAFFQWALLMEAKKQTALLTKLDLYLDGMGRVVESLPDFEKLLTQLADKVGE